MRVIPTKHGLRLSQHGVVISELRTSPGPTHSVFDVLAALLVLLRPAGRIGVLGFAGGGMLAPLRGLACKSAFATVDLDQASYDLFCQHCPDWVGGVQWQRADAVAWLRRQKPGFDFILEDLSVPQDGDVVKPDICWRVLPGLIRQKLNRSGLAVFNLLSPPENDWQRGVAQVTRGFRAAQVIHLDDFENRILIAGNELPAPAVLSRGLRGLLRKLRSRQAERVHVRKLPFNQA